MAYIYRPPKKKKNHKLTERRAERQLVYQSQKWQRLRAAYLAEHPTCEQCLAEGRVTPAMDVHHVRSFMSTNDPFERAALAFDYNNLRALCRACHTKEHSCAVYNECYIDKVHEDSQTEI